MLWWCEFEAFNSLMSEKKCESRRSGDVASFHHPGKRFSGVR